MRLQRVVLSVLGLALFGMPLQVLSAYRCVPTRVDTHCPVSNVYSDWPTAYAAAGAGDVIYLGPNTPPARLVLEKRLVLRAAQGFVLSDEGLVGDPATYLIEISAGAAGTDLYLPVRVTADEFGVPRSAGCIRAALHANTDVKYPARCDGPGSATPTVGFWMERGTGPKAMTIKGVSIRQRVVAADLGVGFHIEDGVYFVLSYVRGERNGVGYRQHWGLGQNFDGEWVDNEVAMEVQGVYHQDTNVHAFSGNGLMLLSRWSDTPNPVTGCRTNGPHLEYNWWTGTTRDPLDPEAGFILVERTPGVFVTDRTQDPGGQIQYSSAMVDGMTYPTFNTGPFDDDC